MAYRRKHGTQKASTFEDLSSFSIADDDPSTDSLAAQAIRASAAHRESSLSSAYGDAAFFSSVRDPMQQRSVSFSQTPVHHEYTSTRRANERNTSYSKDGFWDVLARKAKSILEDDNTSQKFDDHNRKGFHILDASAENQPNQANKSPESNRKSENLANSLNYIGGTIRNALEEGLTIVENRTANIIHETKKLQIRRKAISSNSRSQTADFFSTENLTQDNSELQNQLKASRDAANAMAAKAKLLLRDLKTIKADLAFSKERCFQLEEENKLLRESRQKSNNSEDDDLIRLQLETLLAEKGRLAHENSIYARENRFLREIVEYHQLTMQDHIIMHSAVIDENIQSSSSHHSAYSSSEEEVLSPSAISISSPNSPSLHATDPIISAPEEVEPNETNLIGSSKGLLFSPSTH